jgi:hypothetical protein
VPLQVTSTTRVQITFTASDPDRPDGLTYSDALYYPMGQVPANALVRAAAVARYQAWRAAQDLPRPRLPRAERLRLATEAKDAAIAQLAASDAAWLTEQTSTEP